MFSTGLIVFREVMEIAIILSVVLAATQGVTGRAKWIWLGLGAGVVSSAFVAAFAEQISSAMEGFGQEYFNALILFIAVAVLGWTVVWMKHHAKEIGAKLKHVGLQVKEGEQPLWMVSVVIAAASVREGAEIVLFLYGSAAASQESLAAIATGGLMGLGIGVVVGWMLYAGLIRVATKHLFTVTSWMLVLLAAGMAAQGAGYLVSAGAIPGLIEPVWDSSAILSEEGMIGKMLHALVGYSARPSLMQVFFYLAALAAISLSLLWSGRKHAPVTR